MPDHKRAPSRRSSKVGLSASGLGRWLPWAFIVVGALGLLWWWGLPLWAFVADILLRTLGLTVVFWPPAIVVTALVAWRRPQLLRRYWRRWLGALVLALALTVLLSFFATKRGILSEVGLGGQMGRALGRNLPLGGEAIGRAIASIRVELPGWRIAVATAVLALAGFLLVAPQATLSVLRRLLRWAWDIVSGLWYMAVGLVYRLRTGEPPLPRPAPMRLQGPEPPPSKARTAVSRPAQPSDAEPAEAPPGREAAPIHAPLAAPRRPAAGEWWRLPPITLLDAGVEPAPNGAETQRRARLVEEALASYGIEARVVETSVGPTVTRFGVEPGWVRRYKDLPERDALGRLRKDEVGRPITKTREVSRIRVKVEAIANLNKDLALALAAPSLRIEAPVPGKGYVGLEVPNSSFTAVTLRSVIESPAFAKLAAKSKLALALGKGVGGEPVTTDLATLPHLLIAGATGSGKSVCLKAFLTCLAMKATPDDVRLILVDPKRVELATFARLPHLLFPPVVETDKVSQMLKDLVAEMESRYRKFAALKVNNLENYNHAAPDRHLPRIVIFVDELADLMMVAPVDVEQGLSRLAQLGRAAGIHLVVATQRPSVDVVTGLIKANFPARISFSVASQVDSRVVLDAVGAEKLLGKGDMLFQPTDYPQPKRVQGVLISEPEIEKVVDHWSHQAPPAPRRVEAWPVSPPAPARPPPAPASGQTAPRPVETGDPLLQAARELAAQMDRVSPSLFQRRLRIGHGKAEELLQALETEGAVGPPEGGGSRQAQARGAALPGKGAATATPSPVGEHDQTNADNRSA